MRSSTLVYGVKLNDKRRDGSSAGEIYGALKASGLDRLPARLAGPLAPAILVFGDSIFAGAALAENEPENGPEAARLKAKVDAWWATSAEARQLKNELDLPDLLAPRLCQAECDIPELAEA